MNPAAPDDAPYTLRQIEDLLGLGRGAVTALIAAGFVTPVRGPRNAYRFTFRDVVLLRTAHALRSARVPPRRLLRSLKALRARLPATVPLSGLRIRAVGNEVVVREAGADWAVQSGQLLIDFEIAPAANRRIELLDRGGTALASPVASRPAARPADRWFEDGERVERDDPAAAEAAYRRALDADPSHAGAATNLAALLCGHGRCDEALAVCEAALAHAPADTLLLYNRAIALEDLGRVADALASYERCLAQQPDLADAHYNAARLHERLGQRQQALRHFSAYRRLTT